MNRVLSRSRNARKLIKAKQRMAEKGKCGKLRRLENVSSHCVAHSYWQFAIHCFMFMFSETLFFSLFITNFCIRTIEMHHATIRKFSRPVCIYLNNGRCGSVVVNACFNRINIYYEPERYLLGATFISRNNFTVKSWGSRKLEND